MRHQQIIQTEQVDFIVLELDTKTDTREQEQWQISIRLFNDFKKLSMRHQQIIQTEQVDFKASGLGTEIDIKE